MEGPEWNQKRVQNEAGHSGTKKRIAVKRRPLKMLESLLTALINYVIRRNDKVSAPVCFKAKLKDSHKSLSLVHFQTFLRNLLRDELEKLNIQSFNLSVFLHRRKGDINGVKVKEAYFKAVADLSWEECFEDLKKSCKSKMNSEAFDLFIEVDPAEFVIKDRNSIMVTISDPQREKQNVLKLFVL